MTMLVRFDVQASASQRAWRTIATAPMSQVPDVGDTVNVDGYPYLVVSRAWAVSDGEEARHAYLNVAPANAGQPLPWEEDTDE